MSKNIEGPPNDVMAELDRHVPDMKLPEWFPQIRFASWNCYSLDERLEPNLVDHLYLVFSQPPEGKTFDQYSVWYATHIDENLTTPGLAAGRRFKLEPVVIDAMAEPDVSHLAIYQMETDVVAMRRGLNEGIEAGRIRLPDWFNQIRFVSLEAEAIGSRVDAAVFQAT
jgi:hypothetical protein